MKLSWNKKKLRVTFAAIIICFAIFVYFNVPLWTHGTMTSIYNYISSSYFITNSSSNSSYISSFSLCNEQKVTDFIKCAQTTGLTKIEQSILLRTVVALDYLLNYFNISNFVIGGSLLGFARNGRLIPYDDDFDIFVSRKQLAKIKLAFKEIERNKNSILFEKHNEDLKILRYTENPAMLKVYLEIADCHRPKLLWCFPMIDLILHEEVQKKHETEKKFKEMIDKVTFKEKDVFPVRRGKIDGVDVWIPKNVDFLLNLYYKRKICETSVYSHRYENHVNCALKIPCDCLEGRWNEIVKI